MGLFTLPWPKKKPASHIDAYVKAAEFHQLYELTSGRLEFLIARGAYIRTARHRPNGPLWYYVRDDAGRLSYDQVTPYEAIDQAMRVFPLEFGDDIPRIA